MNRLAPWAPGRLFIARRPRRPDAGSATVLLLAGMLAAGAVCALWVSGARAGLARERAEAAADLAAIAAAQATSSSGVIGAGADPCAIAGEIATANAGHLIACALQGDDVEVTVAVEAPVAAHATAKAGPVR